MEDHRTSTRPVRRRHLARGGALLVAAAFGLAGCDGVTEAVDDARQAVDEGVDTVRFCVAAGQAAQAFEERDVDAARNAADTMMAHAPAAIEAEVAVLHDAAVTAQNGDTSKAQSQATQDALAAVASWVQDNCDPR